MASTADKSKALGLGPCDFAPAWLKLSTPASSTPSSSLSSSSTAPQPPGDRPQRFPPSSSRFSSSASLPFPTSRARTPSVDVDSERQQPSPRPGTGPLSRSNSSNQPGSSGSGRPLFPGGGPRFHQGENRERSGFGDPFVRRQKSLDTFSRPSDRHDHRSSPPPSRSESSRNFDSYRGGSRPGRGRASFDEDDSDRFGNSRSRGRQTNGSTPSTNPNYFYYGTPPTPPHNGVDTRGDGRNDGRSGDGRGVEGRAGDGRGDVRGGDGRAGDGWGINDSRNVNDTRGSNDRPDYEDDRAGNVSHHRSQDPGHGNHSHSSAPYRDRHHPRQNGYDSAESGFGGATSGEQRSFGADDGYYENRPTHRSRRSMGDAGFDHGSGYSTSRGRDPKRHSNGTNYDSFNGGGGGVLDSAIGYWDMDLAKEEMRESRKRSEPPPPDAEEEFPSLGGAHDSSRGPVSGAAPGGGAVWLGKQNSQQATTISSTSTRVQLKQQNSLGSTGTSAANGTVSSTGSGSILSKSLMPPKRPVLTSTSAAASARVATGSGKTISGKESLGVLELSRLVRPQKIREEKKSQFLRALRSDPSRPASKSSAQSSGDEGGEVPNGHINGVGKDSIQEMEEVFNCDEDIGKRSTVGNVVRQVEGMKMETGEPANVNGYSSVRRPSSLFGRRRRPSSSSSGASADNGSNLSSSLEAEQRLLREMGWEEEEEEADDWQLSEDELREVQAKIQEFHRNQHRNLAPLTVNVASTTAAGLNGVLSDGVHHGDNAHCLDADSGRMSTSEGCTPTDPDNGIGYSALVDVKTGYLSGDEAGPMGLTTAAFLISGFENNNHKSPSFYMDQNVMDGGDGVQEDGKEGSIWNGAGKGNAAGIWGGGINGINGSIWGAGNGVASFLSLGTPGHTIWQNALGEASLRRDNDDDGDRQDSESDLSDVDSD